METTQAAIPWSSTLLRVAIGVAGVAIPIVAFSERQQTPFDPNLLWLAVVAIGLLAYEAWLRARPFSIASEQLFRGGKPLAIITSVHVLSTRKVVLRGAVFALFAVGIGLLLVNSGEPYGWAVSGFGLFFAALLFRDTRALQTVQIDKYVVTLPAYATRPISVLR